MTRAIFLDRDGVIVEDKGYVHKIGDLRIIPGVIGGLKKVQDYSDYKLIIVTNQSGIARKFYTEKEYFDFRNCLHKILEKEGVLITAEYFCPHHPNENCNCRKPKTGMLEQAAKDFDLDLKKCWMIGDKSLDIIAGKNAGCKTIHISTEKENPITYANFVAKDLIEAANYIIKFY